MMPKYELAQYCANLLAIMVSKETAGQPRGMTLAEEYTRAYDELRGIIDKEKEDEARKSEQQRAGGQKERTYPPQGLGGSSEPAWPSGGQAGGGAVSGQRLSGPAGEESRSPQSRQPRET